MAIFNGYIIPDYFITGVIPAPSGPTSDQMYEDMKLCTDCINVLSSPNRVSFPPIVFWTVVQVSRHLGMDKFDPPLPATVEGFVEYARGAGIVFEESMAKRKII